MKVTVDAVVVVGRKASSLAGSEINGAKGEFTREGIGSANVLRGVEALLSVVLVVTARVAPAGTGGTAAVVISIARCGWRAGGGRGSGVGGRYGWGVGNHGGTAQLVDSDVIYVQ